AAARKREIVDGESRQLQRLSERPEGLCRHERDVPGAVRRRAAGADDNRGRRWDSRELTRGNRRDCIHVSGRSHRMRGIRIIPTFLATKITTTYAKATADRRRLAEPVVAS